MRLDRELVRRRLVPTRAAARRAILDGRVSVEGAPTRRPATGVDAATGLGVDPEATRYVGRGGHKLEAALDAFALDPSGLRCLDVGASTGGFTDCLLQRGALTVVAVDVGRGQLHRSLLADARVVAVEGTDIRNLDPAAIDAPFPLVTVDVSFISLRLLAETLAGLCRPGGDLVALVKPQFEVGRGALRRDGVVADDSRGEEAVGAVIDHLAACGLAVGGLIDSPIAGAAGNREQLAWLRHIDQGGTRG